MVGVNGIGGRGGGRRVGIVGTFGMGRKLGWELGWECCDDVISDEGRIEWGGVRGM